MKRGASISMNDQYIEDLNISAAFDLLGWIYATPSNLVKKDYLAQGRVNPVFRSLLVKAYNPFLVYHVKNIDPRGGLTGYLSLRENYNAFMDLLNDLQTQKLTGGAALGEVNQVFAHFTGKEVLWYLRVLKKDLNIGIKAKTINEVIPDLIPQFGVQLAHEHDGRLPVRVIIQPKLDGYRAVGSTTTGHLYSRNGKLLEGYTSIEEQLKLLPDGYMIDGEIMSLESFKGTQQSAFKKTTGKSGFLNAFDIYGETDSAITELSQLERLSLLEHTIEDAGQGSSIWPLRTWFIAPTTRVGLMEQITEYYNACLALGYEGIMIKDADAPYEMKRGYNWQKMKPVQSIDIKVIGIETGKDDTKYVDCVGKLVCDFNGNEVRVGSGLSDEQRLAWWINPTLIVGKTIEVLYQEISSNEKGGTSLRFPRFKRIRDDK